MRDIHAMIIRLLPSVPPHACQPLVLEVQVENSASIMVAKEITSCYSPFDLRFSCCGYKKHLKVEERNLDFQLPQLVAPQQAS